MTLEQRSRLQIQANQFDADFYRLMRRAEALDHLTPDFAEVAEAMAIIRPVVRKHMHQRDREETS